MGFKYSISTRQRSVDDYVECEHTANATSQVNAHPKVAEWSKTLETIPI